MPNTEALIRFTAGQALTAATFPANVRLVYEYAVGPGQYTEAYINNDAYFFGTMTGNWYMQIKFTAGVTLWDQFFVGSDITYGGVTYTIDAGSQLNYAPEGEHHRRHHNKE
jgi:hypothetical protein